MIATSMRGHGLITERDLKNTRPWGASRCSRAGTATASSTAPPPSSGGIGLVQMLKMKADLKDKFDNVPLNPARYVHLVAEIEKRVFADRAQYLGDPDFYKVPVAQLLNDDYILKRAQEVNPDAPSDTKSVDAGPRHVHAREGRDDAFLGRRQMGQRRVEHVHDQRLLRRGASWPRARASCSTTKWMTSPSKPGVANKFGVVGSDANAIAAPENAPRSRR